jgi:hypothetical protein
MSSLSQTAILALSTELSSGLILSVNLKGHSDENFLLRILKDSSLCIFKSIVVP